MQMGMLPPHQTLPSCYYHPKPEYCTHRTRVPQSLELSPAQGHEVRSYQHARCLGAWQELQQGWEQVQREQSKAEEGIIRWNGQRMSVLIKLPHCRRARWCTITALDRHKAHTAHSRPQLRHTRCQRTDSSHPLHLTDLKTYPAN